MSTQNVSLIGSRIALAVPVAIRAGAAILEYYGADVPIETKKDDSPLTLADLASNKVICEGLSECSDEQRLPILSEEIKQEEYQERKFWDWYWLVDPLDGTKEFISQNGEFTVNIALMHNNRPVAGVIVVPARSELYWGAVELGAYRGKLKNLNDFETKSVERLISATEKLDGSSSTPRNYRIIGSRSHSSPEYLAFVEELKQEYPDAETISAGSSLKFCRVAEGEADIYPRIGTTMEWDTAAGHAIVSAVGKKVMIYGKDQELIYNKEDLRNPWFVVR